MAEASESLLEKMPEQLKTAVEDIPAQISNARLEQKKEMTAGNYNGKGNLEEDMTVTDEKPDHLNVPEKAWANAFDEDMRFECARNGAIQKVESEHSWAREDRRWMFECVDILPQASSSTCAWTKDAEVNEFDHPFYYECPVNHYLAGTVLLQTFNTCTRKK